MIFQNLKIVEYLYRTLLILEEDTMKIRLHRLRTVILINIILILVISTVSYAFAMFTEAKASVEQNITNFSRGTYDILIRPENARTNLEKQLNLVEENYLGIGNGGISVAEWEEIKNHPDVDIAAPVASIGLFTARERTFMIENESPSDRYYYEIEYFTSDGINTYSNKDDNFMYDFGYDIIEFLHYPSNLTVFQNYNRALGDYIASFLYPRSYHQVVAVDPEEEGRLTEYDLTPLTEYVYDRDSYMSNKSIPILSLGDVTVPVSVKLTIDELSDPTIEEVDMWNELLNPEKPDIPLQAMLYTPEHYREILDNYISEKRLFNEEVYEFEPADDHSPFRHEWIYFDKEKSTLTFADSSADIAGTYLPFTNRFGYQLDPVKYEITDGEKLMVKQIGKDEEYGAPIYREMHEVEFYEMDENENLPLNSEDFFDFISNGTFSIKENTADLASAPLGIYGRDAPYLASNPKTKLHPSAVPGSFITTPAHGLISIEHAEKLKGDRPIDAIRVRVAGITGYDRQAASLIEDLAVEWEEKGFTVDIVAGASLQDISVNVEGIGEVVQAFTSLGAADTVVSSWNAIQVGMTGLYGLVALTFVGFTFLNMLKDRRKDEKLLAQIGWSEKLLRRLRHKEWSLMLGFPILFVFVGFAFLGYMKDEWLPFFISIIISMIFIGLFFLGEVLKNKEQKQAKKQVKSITLQNIKYYANSLFAACTQLVFMTIITCFLPFFLIQNVNMTKKTRLGAYVHGEIEGIFIIVIILLYLLSVTTILQSLQRMWERRKSEIELFLYLGWDAKVTKNYFLKEVFLWAGISIFIGLLISLSITMILLEVTLATILLQVGGFIIILMITLISSIVTLGRFQIKGGGTVENIAK